MQTLNKIFVFNFLVIFNRKKYTIYLGKNQNHK